MDTLTLALLLTMVPAGDAPLSLAEAGQPRAIVVIPDRASATVVAAGEELAAYLARIVGTKPPVVAESKADTRVRIDVGPTRNARSLLPQNLFGEEERVVVRTVPGGVMVCGGGDRGTLYAVYRFLEHLGCRWLAPGEQNEMVPHAPDLVAAPIDLDTQPAFHWRLFNGSSPECKRWGLKVGMNGFYTPASAASNGNAIYYPDACSGVHAYVKIMPPEKYFREHPDWYPMLGGKRVASQMHGRQLCVTARGLADEFAANVSRIFDEDPGCQVVSISPNDGYGWCECPDCTGLDQKLCGGRSTKQGLNAERPFQGDRVFWFANEVARRVAQKHPDKKLLVLAYVNYAEPPDTVRPLPNVVPFLCHYAPADYSRPIADPASEANRQFNDALVRWVKITPEVMLYSYVSKSQWWRLPRPVLRNFAADIRYLHEVGIRRYYCQSTLSDWPLDGPLYYVIARLLWDPSADPQAIADAWTEQMFGPAAAVMKKHYEAVENAVRRTGRSYAGNPRREVPGLFDHEMLDEAMVALQRAEKAAADELCRGRVAEVAKVFRYGDAMVRAIDSADDFDRTADIARLDEAIALGTEALQYVRQPDAAACIESWKQQRDTVRELGVFVQGFGEAEIRGGRTCYNSDETGPGDRAHGWATLFVPTPDPSRPVTVEIDAWGTSALSAIVVNTKADVWTRIQPQARLSGKPQWETLIYSVPVEALDPERKIQRMGFGGADSQVWIAEVRWRQE